MGCLSTVNKTWSKIWSVPGLNLFPPLGDLKTFTIIALQCTWTSIFIATHIGENLTFTLPNGGESTVSMSQLIGTLAVTLGFILPLQMSTALSKNAASNAKFGAFSGDCIAMSWEIAALSQSKYDEIVIPKLYQILKVLPQSVKHHFRHNGNVNLAKLTASGDKKIRANTKFKHVAAGKSVKRLVDGKKINMVDACMLKLLDYINDLAGKYDKDQQRELMKTWNRVYSSWGGMNAINGYKPPTIYTYVLNFALLLYIVLLPFTMINQGFHAVWMAGLITYFFLGLNIAGQKAGNAFAEGSDKMFDTVTGAAADAVKNITFSESRAREIRLSDSSEVQTRANLVQRSGITFLN